VIEDKLTHEERINLECLAIASARAGMGSSAETIVITARIFTRFIKEGERIPYPA